MSASINTNLLAMRAMSLSRTPQNIFHDTAIRLASGLRIYQGSQDVAGLSISEKLIGQLSGLFRAGRNAQDGISLIQTADGALNEIHGILQRMRELAVQGATDVLTSADRGNISSELTELVAQITLLSTDTTFNTRPVLDGSLGAAGTPLTLQVGANEGDAFTLAIEAADAGTLSVDTPPTAVDGSSLWSAYIGTVDDAIDAVSEIRASLGAAENSLNSAMRNLDVIWENTKRANSAIRDADFGEEVGKYRKALVLMETSNLGIVHAKLDAAATLALFDLPRQGGPLRLTY